MNLRLLAFLLTLPVAAQATPDDLRSLAGMQNHNRVLLAFAPTLGDQRLEAQRQAMAQFALGAASRDLLLVQVAQDKVIGAKDDANRLRRKFRVGANDYRSVLIGKDGKVALAESAPLDQARLQATIDAMPMRQAEVARAKAGKGETPAQ